MKLESLLKEGSSTGSLALSLNAINEASVAIIVFNPYSKKEDDYDHYRLLMDMQGIGAAVQTLILAAEESKLGTLWICDILYYESEVCAWLGRDDELVAALAIGYPNQFPNARPRKTIEDVIKWME